MHGLPVTGHPETAAEHRPTRPGAGPVPRIVFWELTQGCNLACQHCRAEAQPVRAEDELSTEQCLRVIDDILAAYRPVLILTGGEPLYRPDLFTIASYAAQRGARICLASNGTLIDEKVARQIREVGVRRVAISLDGATPEVHDTFRRIPGAWEGALRGAANVINEGVEVQFNITVSQHNKHQVPDIIRLAEERGATACHLFVLVPVGCGVQIANTEMLSPEEVEAVLEWLYDLSERTSIEVRATCGPMYHRIMRQKGGAGAVARAQAAARMALGGQGGQGGHGGHPGNSKAGSRGCLAGSCVCFISHSGTVQPCGYLPVPAGNVLEQSFREIWEESPLFQQLRDPNLLGGKCGECEYRVACGGCRARAYYQHNHVLAEEPYCIYQPGQR